MKDAGPETNKIPGFELDIKKGFCKIAPVINNIVTVHGVQLAGFRKRL